MWKLLDVDGIINTIFWYTNRNEVSFWRACSFYSVAKEQTNCPIIFISCRVFWDKWLKFYVLYKLILTNPDKKGFVASRRSISTTINNRGSNLKISFTCESLLWTYYRSRIACTSKNSWSTGLHAPYVRICVSFLIKVKALYSGFQIAFLWVKGIYGLRRTTLIDWALVTPGERQCKGGSSLGSLFSSKYRPVRRI